MKFSYISLLILVPLAMACHSGQSDRSKDGSGPNLYSTDADDEAMNKAMATARIRMPRFDSAFDGRDKDMNFSIKVKFSAPDGGNEYIWLTDIWKKEGRYWGVMSDTPKLALQVKLGDSVEIKNKDIVDWMYGTDTVIHGGFTTRLILSRLSKEERAREEGDMPYKIVD
jgi:uncharacterized protein YegJ (DUF2314 family)